MIVLGSIAPTPPCRVLRLDHPLGVQAILRHQEEGVCHLAVLSALPTIGRIVAEPLVLDKIVSMTEVRETVETPKI